MELKQATAGTMESGDIMIQIAPTDHEGLEIQLQSSVAYQFGDQIRHVIEETLTGLGITRAEVHATDKGALDCTIRARISSESVPISLPNHISSARSRGLKLLGSGGVRSNIGRMNRQNRRMSRA